MSAEVDALLLKSKQCEFCADDMRMVCLFTFEDQQSEELDQVCHRHFAEEGFLQ